ncbi:MAG: ABC-2 family transporter protein [Treponema sp.]|jgi:ABC-2 type transport system permease protein|nr:ABC-2 family transporter protein [Treponema sp.]
MNGAFACYRKLVGAYWKSRFVHPVSPVIHTIGLGLTYFSSFLGLWIVLDRFGAIGGWGKGQIVFIYGISLASYGVRCLFFIPFTDLPKTINEGSFDRFLLRPVNPFIQIMGNRFDPGSFAHLGVGILMIVIFRNHMGVRWDLSAVGWTALAVCSAGLTQGAITVAIGVCAFFLQSVNGLNQLYGNLRAFIQYPVTLYNRVVQGVLFFVIPLAFASYVPAGAVLSNPEYDAFSRFFWRFLLLAGPVFLALSYRFWLFGIRRYQSTGS